MGTPTDHVERVTGQKPESFGQTTRRYLQNPALIHPQLAHVSKLGAIALLVRTLFSRVPDWEAWECDRNHPLLQQPLLAVDSPEWVACAQKQQLNLLPAITNRPTCIDTLRLRHAS